MQSLNVLQTKTLVLLLIGQEEFLTNLLLFVKIGPNLRQYHRFLNCLVVHHICQETGNLNGLHLAFHNTVCFFNNSCEYAKTFTSASELLQLNFQRNRCLK